MDYRFNGKTSIKNIMPVLAPELSYRNLPIRDGIMLMQSWAEMVMDNDNKEDREQTRRNILEYCKLDTGAIIRVYQELKK